MGATIAPWLITLALAFAHPGRAPTSDAIAAINAPTRGQRVNGLVQIIGSAIHPTFGHYELHFALDPNPTDTWFPIVLAGGNSVENASLAQWDTGSISTGTYILRLQVFGSDVILLAEAFVPGIAVRAGPEPATLTPAPMVASAILLTPVPTHSLPVNAKRDARNSPVRSLFAQRNDKHDYRSTFLYSAVYSVAAFLALGVYLQLRRLVRPHVRRLLRRVRSDLRRP